MTADNSKVLTQREIDALLNVADSGDEELGAAPRGLPRPISKAVKLYDFRRPDKFSKDQIRTLQAMHQALGRVFAASLSSQLRSIVTMRMSSIDQGLYEEYIQQVQTPSILNIVAPEPLLGSIVIEYSSEIGMTIVDRLLGGPGKMVRGGHEITDVELALLKTAATPVLAGLTEAWENLIELRPVLQEIALSPQFLQVARAGDVVIMVFFEVQIGEIVGGLSICLPYQVLEPVMPRLNAQSWFSTPGHREVTTDNREDLKKHLLRTPLELSASVGTTELVARDIVTLKAGDVLRLDREAGAEIDVLVANRRKFRARPGLVGRKLGLRVTAVLDDEEQSIEDALLLAGRA